jgi:hypothetical protein
VWSYLENRRARQQVSDTFGIIYSRASILEIEARKCEMPCCSNVTIRSTYLIQATALTYEYLIDRAVYLSPHFRPDPIQDSGRFGIKEKL